MKYRILKNIPNYSPDGIRGRDLEAGNDEDIREDLVPGLKAAGLIGDVPPGEKAAAPPQTQETKAERVAREAKESADAQAEKERLEAEATFKADAKRKAAGALVGQVDTLEWNEFVGQAVEILGKEARGLKKDAVVEALKRAAEPFPPEPPPAAG